MLQNKMTMIGLGVSPKTQLLLLRNDSRWPSLGDVGEYELTVQLHYDRTSTEIVLLVKGTDSWGSVKDQLRSQRPDLSDKGRLQIVHNGSGSSEPNDNHSLFVSYAGSVFRAGRANTVNVVCGIQEMEAAAFEDVPVIVDNGDDSEKDYPLDFETELCVFAKHLSTEIESLSGPSKRNFWITWDEPTVKKHVHNFLISDKRHLNDFRALTDEQIDQLAGYLARASGHAISSSHITRALTAMSPTASSNSALPVEADFDAWNLTLSDFVDRLTLLYHTEIVKPPRPWDVATMTMLIKRSMYAYFNATNGYEIPEEFGALTDQQIARLSADLTSTSGHVVSSSLIRRAISALRYQACDISTEAVKRLKSKPAEDENREAAEGVSIQLAQMPQVQTSVASSDPAQYYAQLAQTPEARTQLAARRTSVDPDLRVPTADLEADKARKIVCFRDFFKAAEQLVEETETLKVCCFCGQGVGPEQMAHARNDFDAQIQTNEEALMACRVLYRSKPCYRWQAGACKFGDECRFKHETSDAKHRPSDAQKAANATNAADDETVSSRMSRRGSDFLKLAAVVKKTMEKKRVCGFCNQSAGPAIVAHIDAEVQKTESSLTHLANEPRDTNVTECAQDGIDHQPIPLGTDAEALPGLDNCIDLQYASEHDIKQLDGLGQTAATWILNYRQKHGFDSLDDLLQMKGFGARNLRKLKVRAVVSACCTSQPLSHWLLHMYTAPAYCYITVYCMCRIWAQQTRIRKGHGTHQGEHYSACFMFITIPACGCDASMWLASAWLQVVYVCVTQFVRAPS